MTLTTFTPVSPVVVGLASKKSFWDKAYDNTFYLQEAFQRLFGRNLLGNPDYQMCSAGITSMPDYWFATNSPTVEFTGVGIVDTITKGSKRSVKITAGGSGTQITQKLIPTGSFVATMKGLFVSVGQWVRPSVNGESSQHRIFLYDGNTYSYSSYHSGSTSGGPDSDGWEWLTVTKEIGASGTSLIFGYDIPASKAPYHGGVTLWLGPESPAYFIPSEMERRFGAFPYETDLPSSLTTIGGIRIIPGRPIIVDRVKAVLGTAPSGDTVFDLNKNGVSMFATNPKITSGNTVGYADPDATDFSKRCIGVTDKLTADIDSKTGSPADLTLMVYYRQYTRPLEAILGMDDLG